MDTVLSTLKKSAEIRMIRVHLRSILLVKKCKTRTKHLEGIWPRAPATGN